jgi:hypothetical protein
MAGNAAWVIGNATLNLRHTRSIDRECRIHGRNTRTHDVYMPVNDRERLMHHREHLIHDRERPRDVRSRQIYEREGLVVVCLHENFDQRAVIEQVRQHECRRNHREASREHDLKVRILRCEDREP